MSDESQESKSKGLAEIQAEAQRLLGEIEQFRKHAEENAKAAEISKQKADSEALYAFNAKGYCESHSTAIANLKGAAEVELSSIRENKQKSDEFLAAVPVAKVQAEADAKAINEARKEIEPASSRLAEAVRKAEDSVQLAEASKTSAGAVLKETEDLRDASLQARNKTQTAQTEAEQCSEQASEAVVKITSDQTATAVLAAAVKNDTDKLAPILEHLTKSDAISTAYEKRVSEHSANLESLTKKVESLLPGATSASLASSFNSQRERFRTSQRRWLYTFITCIIFLVAVAAPNFISAFADASLTWQVVLRNLVARLPIMIPLIWLAIYAGRNYMLSLRLEEDYAYKEAISMAFEGYKREMTQIPSTDPTSPAPLTILCVNVLKAIAERAGRIYEGKQQDITLFAEAQMALKTAEELGQKQIAK
jgi:chromosome segregation ATPase